MEAQSNWDAYQKDLTVLEKLDEELNTNGKAIVDHQQRLDKATEATKNASDRAKSYGLQIANNTKNLADFKRENEVEEPKQGQQPKWYSGLKGVTSSVLSAVGNTVVSAGIGLIAQKLLSLGIQGVSALIHRRENTIAKGTEAAEAIQNQTKAYEEQKATLGELTAKYTELAKGVKITGNSIKNINLTDDQYQDFLDTSNQIASAAPSLTRSWDSQGNAILAAGTNTEDLNNQVSEYLKLQRNLTYYNSKNNIEKQYEGYKETLESNQKELDSKQIAYDNIDKKFDLVDAFRNSISPKDEIGPPSPISGPPSPKKSYVIDKEVYDSLDSSISSLMAATPVGDKIEVEFNLKDSDAIEASLTDTLDKIGQEKKEAKTNLTNVKESNAAAEREMASSIKSMASTIDSFDKWADQDKAATFQSALATMLNSSDNKLLLNNYKESGKDMDTWLRNNIVNPMATATLDEQKLWEQAFELEPKDKESVEDFATRRDNLFKQIAAISDNDFWTRDTLAEALGFAHTEYDDKGKAKLIWENRNKLDRIGEAFGNNITNKEKEALRESLNKGTVDDLEIAMSVITDEKSLTSVDAFNTAFEKAKANAAEAENAQKLSLSSMQELVTDAQTAYSSYSAAISESKSATGMSDDSIKALTATFSEYSSEKDGLDLSNIFRNTAEGVEMNSDAVQHLIQKQRDLKNQRFSDSIKLQNKLYKEQQEIIDDVTSSEEEKEAARDQQDKINSDLSGIMQAQSQYNALYNQTKDLFSDYNKWLSDSQSETSGTPYNNLVSGLTDAYNDFKNGLIGTDKFKDFAALISPTGATDPENFAENYAKASRYFQDGDKGVKNFLNDLQSQNLAEFNKETDEWSIKAHTAAEAAKALGTGTEVAAAAFGKLEDYGMHNNTITDVQDGILKISDTYTKLAESRAKLKNMEDNPSDYSQTRIDAQREEVQSYTRDIQDLSDNMEYYVQHSAEQYNEQIKTAENTISYMQQYRNELKKNNTFGENTDSIISYLDSQIKGYAEAYDIDVSALEKKAQEAAEAEAQAYQEAVQSHSDKIKQAYEEQNTDITSLVDELSQYTADELKNIDFDDGKWDKKLGNAEKAVEALCKQLGLTKEQAKELIDALDEGGNLKESDEEESSSDGSSGSGTGGTKNPKKHLQQQIDTYADVYKQLQEEQDKIESWGLSSYGNAYDTSGNSFVQKQFGNIDMDKRQVIHWSDELKQTYTKELASWNYSPDTNGVDTVFGGSSRFGEGTKGLKEGVEVAFTPIMNTADGKTTFLGKDTVYDYIDDLIGEATSNGHFSEEKLLSLDKQGRQIGDQFVQGILAAADTSTNYENNGNKAELYGRMMHFSGDYGALGLAYSELGENADTVVSTMGKVTQALDTNDESMQNSLNTIKQYTATELDGIDLFDGKYDSDELKPAEQALDNLSKSFGLTNDEAAELGKVLAAIGLTKPEVDDSEVKEAKTDAEDTKQTYDNLDGSTVSITADVSGQEGVDSFVEQCSSIPQGMSTTITASVSGEDEVESFESGLEQIPDNTPTVVDVTVNNQEDLDNLQGKVDELNANGKDITLNARLKPTADSEEIEVTAKEVKVPVKPDPEELEVKVKPKLTETDVVPTIDANVNIKAINPTSEETTIDAKANITDVTNKNKQDTTIDAAAHITSVINGDQIFTVKVQPESILDELPVHAKLNTDEVDKYTPEEKESTVNFIKNSTIPDKYQPNDKTATVIYGVGHTAVDLWSPPIKHGTVIYDGIQSGSSSKSSSKAPKASGTMTSIAHVNGTMHNAPWNYIPAHAKGDVAIDEPQKALVNEQYINGHSESIVRDGKWSLIPGGAHFENLKKGDIIFSAKQTDDLLKHGSTPGHARTYASGTLGNTALSSAFGVGTFKFSQDQSYNKNLTNNSSSSNSSTASTKATEDNTSATNSNTGAVEEATKTQEELEKEASEALDNAIKTLNDNSMDWLEILADNLERATEHFKDAADSFNGRKGTDEALKGAMEALQKEIDQRKTAYDAYIAYSERVAQDEQVSKYLTPELKQKVQDGDVDIGLLNENEKKAVDAYKEWWDKAVEANEDILDKQKELKELAQQRTSNVTDKYDVYIGKRTNAADLYKSKSDLNVNRYESQKVGSDYYKNLEQQRYNTQKATKFTKKEIKLYQEQMKNYLKTPGAKRTDIEYQEMEQTLIELKKNFIDLTNETVELTHSLHDVKEQTLQWKTDRWDRASSKQQAAISWREAQDDPRYNKNSVLRGAYSELIKTTNKEIIALNNQIKDLYDDVARNKGVVSNELIQEKLDKAAQMEQQVLQLGTNIEQWKNKIMDLRWEPFYDQQDQLDNVINEYQNMQKLLGDTESFYNDDGSFTKNGLTNLLLLQESIDATKDKIANYRVALDKLDEQYKNGCYSQEEYTEKSNELLKGLQEASTAMSEYRQSMLDMYETQITKENDLLQENIDKRLEALDAKEKYYDYDKTLKKKSKDINTLKAQIAALEGTSNAAAKARLEKLRAELADAEEDMQDTVHNHEVEMKKTGFENLQDDANTALDNTLDALKKNTKFQEAVIGNMLDTVTKDYDSTYSHLHDLMNQYGTKVSQTFDKMIGKAADFNREAGKVSDVVNKINTSRVDGASDGTGGSASGGGSKNNSQGQDIVKDTATNNNKSNDAGNQNPGAYTLSLDKKVVYLTYTGKTGIQLKVNWKPSTPKDYKLTWKSSNEKVAKVSSSGKVTSVSSETVIASSSSGGVTGTISSTPNVTRNCTIQVTDSVYGSSDTCKVYVLPSENYENIKQYEASSGQTMTSAQLQDALEYSYKHGKGANHNAGVEYLKKDFVKNWWNSLEDITPVPTDKLPKNKSDLVNYFALKGKKIGRAKLQEFANIVGIKTPGANKFEEWTDSTKNKLLNQLKSYGYSKGGVVRSTLQPTSMSDLFSKAVINNGDSGFITANPGETVLTEEFTRQLKPTTDILKEFNNMVHQPILSSDSITNRDISVTNDYQIILQNANLSSTQDINKLVNILSDKISAKWVRDFKKLK